MIAMQNDPLHVRDQAYSYQLETLREEIQVALSAISGNALGALQDSLWRQEVLCAGLNRLLHSLQETGVDLSALHRMRAATASLYALNQTYADLVQQSRESTDLMYALCQNYQKSSPRLLDYDTAHSYSAEA